MSRADASSENMGLTSWKGSVVRIGDIFVAKNYLQKEEIDTLNRLVTLFLESAELRVKNRRDLSLSFWKENVNELLQFQGKDVLKDVGSISNKEMEEKVRLIYDKYNERRKKFDARAADAEDIKILEELNKQIERRQK